MEFDDISYNFKVAKVLSILMVATGHYFGGVLWIPTTFALFVFAFSSGFFTSMKYHYPFNIRRFYYAKIVRLGYPILVIDVFLLFVFLVQKKTNIVSWQTLPSLIGANGFLTWFNLTNPSPFGSGLWFFTLLLLFYFFYPLLSILNKNHSIALTFVLVSLFVTTIFQYLLPMGHMLWLTAFAFILGHYSGFYSRSISPLFCVLLMVVSCLLLIFLKIIIGYNSLNYLLILIASTSIIGYLLNRRLPDLVLKKLLVLSNCIIQIYFIHTYLFVHSFTVPHIVNYMISMIMIVSLAFVLSKISDGLSTFKSTKAQTISPASG